jgi:hypothetical protein
MKRIARVLALAAVFGGAAHLGRPSVAHATMAPAPSPFGDGVTYCCWSSDHMKSCCFETGCTVSSSGCFKIP